MSYNIRRTDEPKGAPHAAQAFTFDGWSHEPLVIDSQLPPLSAVPKHDTPAMMPRRTVLTVD